MAVFFFPIILFLLPLFAAAKPSSPPPVTTSPPPPQTSSLDQEHQLNNIIAALIGSGNFAGWVNLLSSTDPSTLPLTATLFIPSNDAVSHFPVFSAFGIMPFDPLLVPYHIIPQRLTFSDLRKLRTHTLLPTLLPSKYIVVTNNSPSNFTVDDSRITQADIFVNAAFSVHGIEKVLDYSVYGNSSLVNNKPPARPKSKPKPPNGRRPDFPVENTAAAGSRSSGAACLSGEVLMFFTCSCGIIALINIIPTG